ncbi:uncharacterized protein AB675_7147 [Cyphellophora attinorum]|uniref:Uncharacterized protein n=1 Tax=Cyphellophora attinorum TaxID=1664694 RepID=A0A0N0NQ97_9EURO|nr:uncharacterized protein AB675_7147 [Phialophora attinorum]KPI43449.1 hypothetical protein AB675_7147 [Phialophora attinorum]
MPFIAAYTLSALRIATGLGLIAFPHANFRLAQIAQPSAASGIVAARFMGARELAVGGLLWHVLSENSGHDPISTVHADETTPLAGKVDEHKPRSLSMLKSVLVAAMVADTVDIGSCAICVLDGSLTVRSALGVGALGVVGVAWGFYCYRGASQKEKIRT